MKRLIAICAMVILAGCQEETAVLDDGLDGYDPHSVDIQRASCLEREGRFGEGTAEGTFLCYLNTKDAEKSCSKSTDCDGECLARSRTCSPIKPILGCQDILSSSGKTSRLCVN